MNKQIINGFFALVLSLTTCAPATIASPTRTESETLSRVFTCLDKVEKAAQELQNQATTAFIMHNDPKLFTQAVRKPIDSRIYNDDVNRIATGIDDALGYLKSLKSQASGKVESKRASLGQQLQQAKERLSMINWVKDSVTQPINDQLPAAEQGANQEYLDSNLEDVGRDAAEIGEDMYALEKSLDQLSESMGIPYSKQRSQIVVLRMACCGDLFLAEKAKYILLEQEEVKQWRDAAKANPAKQANMEVISQDGNQLTVCLFDNMPGIQELVSQYIVDTSTGKVNKIHTHK